MKKMKGVVLNRENFASCVNQVFEVAVGSSSVDLTLIRIRQLKANHIRGLRREPFALIFRCALRTMLPQKIYQMRNATLGALSMSFTPVGMDRDGVLYEAVFN